MYKRQNRRFDGAIDSNNPLIVAGSHSFIHSFVHSFVRSFVLPFIHTFVHSFVHSFIHPFIHLFIHSSIHQSISPSFPSFIQSCIDSFVGSALQSSHSIEAFTQPFSHSLLLYSQLFPSGGRPYRKKCQVRCTLGNSTTTHIYRWRCITAPCMLR